MPVTEAQKRATAKYERENYDKVLTRFPKGTKEKILQTGAKSVNGFIISAVNEKIEREVLKNEWQRKSAAIIRQRTGL